MNAHPMNAPRPALADALLRAVDPTALMESQGFTPYPWQRKFLTSTAKRIILCCCRQSGKSLVAGALGGHLLLYRPGSLVLASAPTMRQAKDLFRWVSKFTKGVPEAPEPDADSTMELELPTGSRLVALPGGEPDNVRGPSPDLILLDEAAFSHPNLLRALKPMLAATKGRLVVLSSPNGRGHWFEDAWTNGGADWERYHVSAYDVPHYDREHLAAEEREARRSAGGGLSSYFRREYLAEFADAEEAVFAEADIQRALSADVPPLFEVNPADPALDSRILTLPASMAVPWTNAGNAAPASREYIYTTANRMGV